MIILEGNLNKLKMKKLGIGYNCFGDSIELLEASIKTIKNVADYVVVVYQDVSNFGNKSPVEQLPILQKLKNLRLIDDYVLHKQKLSFFFRKKNA
jgi:hypothetical protein